LVSIDAVVPLREREEGTVRIFSLRRLRRRRDVLGVDTQASKPTSEPAEGPVGDEPPLPLLCVGGGM
jgi:hypothetical protein